MNSLSRRSMLMGSVGVAALPKPQPEQVYRFSSAGYEIRMTLEFHDNYGANGLRFRERLSDRRFCLSFQGEEDQNCVGSFTGSVAVARYRIFSPRSSEPFLSLREYVRSIDRCDSVPPRPDYERVIELQHGVASDIQAFGYQRSPNEAEASQPDTAWVLFRQDLYLEKQATPFLVVHWKHTVSAIRVLDIIPGAGTLQFAAAEGRR